MYIYTHTFIVIRVRWNYFVCRWYRKNDKWTNGLKRKKRKCVWVLSECISGFHVTMNNGTEKKKNEMFISIFTAACKLLFDNIFTWVRACVSVCIGSICFNSQLCRSYKNIPIICPFLQHICMDACMLVSFFFVAVAANQDWLCHASKFCVESVILWEIKIEEKNMLLLLDANKKI